MKHFVLLAALLAGCGSISDQPPDGGAPDAAVTPSPDAGVARAGSGAVVLSAGGTVQNATYTLDVQVGQAYLPRPTSSGSTTMAPHGAIDP